MVVTSVVVLQVKDSKKPAGNRLRAYIIPSNIALCQHTLHDLPIAYPFRGNCATYSLGRLVLLRRPTARSIRSPLTASRCSPTTSPHTGDPYRRLPLSSHCGARGQAVLYHLLACRCVVAYGREWYEPILVIGLTYIGCLSEQYRSRREPI